MAYDAPAKPRAYAGTPLRKALGMSEPNYTLPQHDRWGGYRNADDQRDFEAVEIARHEAEMALRGAV